MTNENILFGASMRSFKRRAKQRIKIFDNQNNKQTNVMATTKKVAAPKKQPTKKSAAPKKVSAKKTATPKKSAPAKKAAEPKKGGGLTGKALTFGKKPDTKKVMSDEVKQRVSDALSGKSTPVKKTDKTVKTTAPKAAAAAPAAGEPKVVKKRALRGQMALATYDSFAALDNKNLAPGNTVIFTLPGGEKIAYHVTANGMTTDKEGEALKVFAALGIDPARMARKTFSYAAGNDGFFPTCKIGDMASLTRMVLVLFLFLEGAEAVSLKMYNRHWKLIEMHMIEAVPVAPVAPELPIEGATEAVQ